jgi:hypothetical protein
MVQLVRTLHQNIMTAEKNKAYINGIKKCKIQISSQVFTSDVLISNNLVRNCIVGLDKLTTNQQLCKIIEDFKQKNDLLNHQLNDHNIINTIQSNS